MKRLAILILSLACSTTILAQDREARRVLPPSATNAKPSSKQPSSKPIQARTRSTHSARTNQAPAPKPPTPPRRNITIQVGGNFQGLVPMDLALTGTGPQFMTDLITNSSESGVPPTIITFEAHLEDRGENYFVAYSLGARIAMKTSVIHRNGGNDSYNIEFRDIAHSGSVVLTPGKPVVISRLNGKELTLTAAPAKKEQTKQEAPSH